jgi:hypothetical protein
MKEDCPPAFLQYREAMPRDFRRLQVLIERLDERTDLVGRLALVEFEKCSIWLIGQGDEGDLPPPRRAM